MNPRPRVNGAVRHWTKVAAAFALVAAFPSQTRAVLACAAAIALEALPLLLFTALASRALGARAGWIAGFLGCGCGSAGSARSIPAAVFTAIAFGPLVAIARVAAGCAIARASHAHAFDPAAELARLFPAAIAAGIVAVCVPRAMFASVSPAMSFAGGALAGAAASPCALGGVALAASIKSASPYAAYGVLATSGIVTIWQMLPARTSSNGDGLTYALLALASGIAAVSHGAALVHPRWTLPLCAACIVCIWFARRDATINRASRALAAGIAIVTVVGAPAPPFTTTATTLSDAYAGEHLTFTGAGHAHALARYAITCCRADAQPIVLAIDRVPRAGAWYRASGVLEMHHGALRMRVQRIEPVAPPADPFVYL